MGSGGGVHGSEQSDMNCTWKTLLGNWEATPFVLRKGWRKKMDSLFKTWNEIGALLLSPFPFPSVSGLNTKSAFCVWMCCFVFLLLENRGQTFKQLFGIPSSSRSVFSTTGKGFAFLLSLSYYNQAWSGPLLLPLCNQRLLILTPCNPFPDCPFLWAHQRRHEARQESRGNGHRGSQPREVTRHRPSLLSPGRAFPSLSMHSFSVQEPREKKRVPTRRM